MNENDPDNFFENIPEAEESTFTFDDVSLRVAIIYCLSVMKREFNDY